MPWSGGVFTRTNGTYSGTAVWNADSNAAIKITDAHHDTHDQDLADGINACVAKDGSNTVTILNLSGTVNSTSGVIKVGSVVLASTYGTGSAFFGGAGNFTLTGTNNTGIGNNALVADTSGAANTAVGQAALNKCTTGASNSAHGKSALALLTTGNFNTAIGWDADVSVTTGSYNIAIGAAAGNATTGSHNIVIGDNATVPSATADNQLSIRNALYGTGFDGSGAGNFGVGNTPAPTARWHLPAGTATAGTAPLKLTAGTNLGTPENGAIEFDGNAVYITIGGVRKTFTVT